jgi:hypothetical protein
VQVKIYSLYSSITTETTTILFSQHLALTAAESYAGGNPLLVVERLQKVLPASSLD